MPAGKKRIVPGRRNSQYEKRLATILKAAAWVIARDGFVGASVRQVAARAKINLSGIYYYFQSKDEMLFALQRQAFSTLVSTLKARLELCRTPEEKLQAVIDNHFEFFLSNMDELKVCVHEIESLSGRYYKDILNIRREYFALVKKVVRQVRGSGGRATADLDALFLFGSLNWVYMWYNARKNTDIKKLSRQLKRIYLRGIQSS